MRKEMDLAGGRDRAYRCRNCQFVEDEDARPGSAPVPGPYCRNPLGVFSMDDCPVLLGRECHQFVEREGPPRAASDEDLAGAGKELLLDYLRWPYWERVRNLRRKPEEIAKKTVLEVEPEPERPEEEIVYRAPAAAPAVEGAAPGKEKPPEEKYPGQRRSEDRYRKQKAAAAEARRKAAEAAEAAAAGAAPPADGATPVPAPDADVPALKTLDEILAETPAAKSVPPPRPQGGPPGEGEGRGRRRKRRRRGGGGGEPRPPGPRPQGAAPPPSVPAPPRPPSPSPAPAGAPPAAGAPGAPAGEGGQGRRRRRRRHRHGRGPRPGAPPGGGAPAPPPPPPPAV